MSRSARKAHWDRARIAVAVAAAAAAVLALGPGTGSAATGPPPPPPLNLAPLRILGSLKPAPAAGRVSWEKVPVPVGRTLAATAGQAFGFPVDGITCRPNMNAIYHIHIHLTIFVNGAVRRIPGGVGIVRPGGRTTGPARCYYTLHTHAADGVIHVESEVMRGYTLGEFFDEWQQPLGPGRVGPAAGRVTALYNGKVFLGDPRDIPLTRHAEIQLEVGSPLIGPTKITWPHKL